MFLTQADQLTHPVKRIISLVPSQTELLYSLGLDKEVIGITKFCIHPKNWKESKILVGGTKNVNIHLVMDLNPDLIIANNEENVRSQMEELSTLFPVWVTSVNSIPTAIEMIETVGQITDKELVANMLSNRIIDNFSLYFPVGDQLKNLKCAYLIWREPYMTIGGDTYISHIMQQAGFENVFAKQKRYPEVSIEQLRDSGCELIMLSSEPYPFKEKHLEELNHHLTNVKIILVDGEMFSWYGSRLLMVPYYLSKLRSNL